MSEEVNFNSTQPPRPWGRLLKAVISLAVLSAVCGVAASACVKKYSAWTQFQTDLVEFQGIRLGQTKQEVQYAVGVPTVVSSPFAPAPQDANPFDKFDSFLVQAVPQPNRPWLAYNKPMPRGKSAIDFDDWQFVESKSDFRAIFDKRTGRLTRIACSASKTESFECDAIFGLSPYASEAETRSKLGKPDRERMDGGGEVQGLPIVTTKTMYYDGLGLEVTLEQKRIYMIVKTAPVKPAFWWWMIYG